MSQTLSVTEVARHLAEYSTAAHTAASVLSSCGATNPLRNPASCQQENGRAACPYRRGGMTCTEDNS